MVRQTRARTAADFSTSFGPPQSSHKYSYLNNFGVGDRIPGFRTSAAFFTSLRANLHLTETTDPFLSFSPTSDMSSSPASTPPSLPASTSSLPLPSPLATAVTTTTTFSSSQQPPASNTNMNTDPLASLPTLTTTPANTTADKVAALRLIADSIAQQRQLASRALIFHPLALSVFMALLALVAQLLYKTRSDLALVGTTWAGLVMAGLVGVRWAVSGYLVLAEEVGWGWIREGEDEVWVTRWGEEVVGVVVVKVVKEDVGGKGRRKGRGRGLVRAWTVKLKFRGKGVGTGLLEEVVRVCREKGVEGPEFADVHANSGRVLPAIFNGGSERREAKARRMLEEIVEAQSSPAKKR